MKPPQVGSLWYMRYYMRNPIKCMWRFILTHWLKFAIVEYQGQLKTFDCIHLQLTMQGIKPILTYRQYYWGYHTLQGQFLTEISGYDWQFVMTDRDAKLAMLANSDFVRTH